VAGAETAASVSAVFALLRDAALDFRGLAAAVSEPAAAGAAASVAVLAAVLGVALALLLVLVGLGFTSSSSPEAVATIRISTLVFGFAAVGLMERQKKRDGGDWQPDV
jgi:uncharacterized membrane protein